MGKSGGSTRRVFRLDPGSDSFAFCSTGVILAGSADSILSAPLGSTVCSFDEAVPGPERKEKESSSVVEIGFDSLSGTDGDVDCGSGRIARVGEESGEEEAVLFTGGRGGGVARRGVEEADPPSVWRPISSAGVSGRINVLGLGKRCFMPYLVGSGAAGAEEESGPRPPPLPRVTVLRLPSVCSVWVVR